MARRLLGACALAGLYGAQGSIAQTITDPPEVPRATESSEIACGWASSASSAWVAANTGAPHVYIPADLAYNCLKTVPNYQEEALALIQSLRTYLEFQSSIAYLKKPPQGYLYPAVDLHEGLNAIQTKVENGEYESEYDMQLAIQTLLISARDGHLSWQGDVINAFQFYRDVGLASVSSDGIEAPQIYVLSDLITMNNNTGAISLRKDISPSPVLDIDSIDVVSYLLNVSAQGTGQDPDANWNHVFSELARPGSLWEFPRYYPGAYTNLTFANGSSLEIKNHAIVAVDLSGIGTGDEAYSVFCAGAFATVPLTATPTSTALTTSYAETETAAPTPEPTVPGYPYPAIKHSDNSIAGYYLNSSDYKDVAVLQVQGFSGEQDSLGWQREFQSVLEKFLSAAVKTGKKKLIIDLLGNGGGYIDSGTDLFAQLFPSMPPDSKTNMRSHLGFWVLGNTASDIIKAAEATPDHTDDNYYENQYMPLAYQTVVDPRYHFFPTFQAYYGPFEHLGYEGGFSNWFQNNYTDPNASDYLGQGIIVTGTNNRTGYTQPFASQDIVVIYDGYCASTCTVISEYLKNDAGVQFIAIGGRPQTGPMQAIGGVKGAQVFPFSTHIQSWTELWKNASSTLLAEANGTIWDHFNPLPVWRQLGHVGGGVNGRNHYRMDERTETPLQFVYEAADCRIWWTPEMLYDPVFLWNRIAQIAFKERKGTQFNSKYCIKDSTGHPTSISGGWKKNTLGPQTPPKGAVASTEGWTLEGKPLEGGSGDPGEVVGTGSTEVEGNLVVDTVALQSIKDACQGYNGDAWFVRLICGALDG